MKAIISKVLETGTFSLAQEIDDLLNLCCPKLPDIPNLEIVD